MARVAFIADDLFEDPELRIPWDRIRAAGHETVLVGLERGKKITGKQGKETFTTDARAADVSADEFDALVIPGGYSPDKIRMDIDMVRLVRNMFTSGKPVAAVCHGPWMLVEAGVVKGKKVTSWPSLKTDLRNAGAEWVDQEVVVDRGLVTSRKPDDIPAFNEKMIEEFKEGRHGGAGRREPARARA